MNVRSLTQAYTAHTVSFRVAALPAASRHDRDGACVYVCTIAAAMKTYVCLILKPAAATRVTLRRRPGRDLRERRRSLFNDGGGRKNGNGRESRCCYESACMCVM